MGSTTIEDVINELHQKLQQEDFSIFKREVDNQSAIVVVGLTRSGKSTLINYLLGTSLLGVNEFPHKQFKIIKADPIDGGPEIGVGPVSYTTIPKVYFWDETLIIDLPGFDDNRSEIQDIVNSVYISQVKFAANVKFVLVFDLNLLLNDNVNQLIDFLKQVHILFKNFDQVKNSVVMVLTKDSYNLSLDAVCELLRSKILSVEGLQVNLEVIQHLIDNIQRLAIFKAPTELGVITNEVDYNIKEAISACSWSDINATDIDVSVSNKSRQLLQKIYNEYLDESFFYNELKKEVDKFKNINEVNNYVFASTDDELENYKLSIQEILRQCRLERVSAPSKLHNVAISIKKIVFPIDQDFEKRLNVLADLDNLFLMNNILRRKFIDYYLSSLGIVINKFESLIKKINYEVGVRAEDKKSRLLYGSVAGGTSSLSVASFALRAASVFPIASLVVGIATAVIGSGTAVSTLMQHEKIKKANQERLKARQRQLRSITENMFD